MTALSASAAFEATGYIVGLRPLAEGLEGARTGPFRLVLTGPAFDFQSVCRPEHRVAERLKHPCHSSTELRERPQGAHGFDQGMSFAGAETLDEFAQLQPFFV